MQTSIVASASAESIRSNAAKVGDEITGGALACSISAMNNPGARAAPKNVSAEPNMRGIAIIIQTDAAITSAGRLRWACKAAGSTRRKARHRSTAKAGVKAGLNNAASGGRRDPGKDRHGDRARPLPPEPAQRDSRRTHQRFQ